MFVPHKLPWMVQFSCDGMIAADRIYGFNTWILLLHNYRPCVEWQSLIFVSFLISPFAWCLYLFLQIRNSFFDAHVSRLLLLVHERPLRPIIRSFSVRIYLFNLFHLNLPMMHESHVHLTDARLVLFCVRARVCAKCQNICDSSAINHLNRLTINRGTTAQTEPI